tara:strand:- start:389 stop:1177 length:789 start_codon:yes stop_codon:yes gene_type:complete
MAITTLDDLPLVNWFDFSLPDACEVDHRNMILSLKDQKTQQEHEIIAGAPTWGNRRVARKRVAQFRNAAYRADATGNSGDYIDFTPTAGIPQAGTITAIVTAVLDIKGFDGSPNYNDSVILSNAPNAHVLMIDEGGGYNSVAVGTGQSVFGNPKHETEIVIGEAYTYLLEWHVGDVATSELWVNGFKLSDSLNFNGYARTRWATGFNHTASGSDRIFEGAYCEMAFINAALTVDEKRDVFEQQRKKWYTTPTSLCGVGSIVQ